MRVEPQSGRTFPILQAPFALDHHDRGGGLAGSHTMSKRERRRPVIDLRVEPWFDLPPCPP
jgi:hypothetical protein